VCTAWRIDPLTAAVVVAAAVTYLAGLVRARRRGYRWPPGRTAITEVGSLADVPAVHQLLAEGRGDGRYVARLQG
jgi:cytochrome c oxidase assembly factor CtaG